jgi:tRNA(Arg) A34 adenosine deaminase TadA
MCAGAIFWGNVRRVVFALSEEDLRVWGAKTLFRPRNHPDLQAEASADAPHR